MQILDLAVVGGGLAGLTVARGATSAGLSVRVFDKGRKIGGRLATRRAKGGLQFDHGAVALDAADSGFATLLAEAEGTGAAVSWPAAAGACVGLPGMNGLAQHLAAGLAVQSECRIGRASRDGGLWTLTDSDGGAIARAHRLVLAIPAAQIGDLLGATHPAALAVAGVVFTPCWTLMAAFDAPVELPVFNDDPDPDAVLARVVLDGAKPGRGGAATVVAQAGAAWSTAHLEDPASAVQAALLDALSSRAGHTLPQPTHAAVHRWRYAAAAQPLGRPCLHQAEEGLVLCGDWCLGDQAEHAWQSGAAALAALGLASDTDLEDRGDAATRQTSCPP